MRSAGPLLVTEALLQAATGLGQQTIPPVPVDNELWLETIRLASAHLVLPALATGLDGAGQDWSIPDDAHTYLDAMREANRIRNTTLKAALGVVVNGLRSNGIEALAVKGAAFLVNDASVPAWRFLSDLDLIVAEEHLARAVGVLAELGFRSAGGDYDVRRDAHVPATLGTDGTTIVELHSRPFASGHWPDLEAALWRDRRADAGIPSAEARVAYLLLHSQEHHGYFAQSRLLLRDLLDLAMLARAETNLDWGAALGHIPEPSRDRAAALLAAGARFGIEMPGINFSSPQRAWAEVARKRLMRPVFHRQLTAAAGLARYELDRIFTDRQRTLRLAKSIAEPRMLGRKILRKLGKLRDRAAG